MPRPRISRPAQGGAATPLFVSYFRVSTDKQGRSGLGLEAQLATVTGFVARRGGKVIQTFQEVESGKRADRPELAKALAACRARGATLVIAKLDRLARNVHFISGLMESGVDFVACDMPQANRLTVHIIAAMAEYEREQISARTKAALDAARARGVKLGGPNMPKSIDSRAARAGRAAQSARSAERAADVLPYIEAARKAGCTSLAQIAEALTARGIKPPMGGDIWHKSQVRRVLLAAAAAVPLAPAG